MTDECAYRGKLIADKQHETIYECNGGAFACGAEKPCGKGEARYDMFGHVCRVSKTDVPMHGPQYMD